MEHDRVKCPLPGGPVSFTVRTQKRLPDSEKSIDLELLATSGGIPIARLWSENKWVSQEGKKRDGSQLGDQYKGLRAAKPKCPGKLIAIVQDGEERSRIENPPPGVRRPRGFKVGVLTWREVAELAQRIGSRGGDNWRERAHADAGRRPLRVLDEYLRYLEAELALYGVAPVLPDDVATLARIEDAVSRLVGVILIGCKDLGRLYPRRYSPDAEVRIEIRSEDPSWIDDLGESAHRAVWIEAPRDGEPPRLRAGAYFDLEPRDRGDTLKTLDWPTLVGQTALKWGVEVQEGLPPLGSIDYGKSPKPEPRDRYVWAWLGRERPIADLLDGKRTIDSQMAAVAPFVRDALTDLDALDPAPFLKVLKKSLNTRR
jgi:hypothetical protein